MTRKFGEVPGYPVGSQFKNRQELYDAGVHRHNQAGICGGKDGAESIVLSGKYADEDNGDVIVYTGWGGRDRNTGARNGDQELAKGNLGLHLNVETGTPVRVIRGAAARSAYSPLTGYRYDGLYYVVESSTTKVDGFITWKFLLTRVKS